MNKKHEGNCQNCGMKGTDPCKVSDGLTYFGISSHHIKPQNKGGTFKDGKIDLCEKCHRLVHTVDGRLNWKEVDEKTTLMFLEKINV